MAGLGAKNFSAGDILTAADVNGYFMAQSVAHYDDAAARSTFFGANPALLFEGRLTYLRDTGSIWIYDGADWTEQTAIVADGGVTAVKLRQVSGSEAVVEAAIRDEAVTSAKIKNLTIVDGDISASASIALSKLATGNLPSGIKVLTANITDLTLKAEDIEDATITSAKLSSGLTLGGTTTFQQIIEKATTDDATILTTTAKDINILSGAVYRFTNTGHSTGFKFNLRGDSLTSLASLMTANTQAVTVCISVVSGSPAVSFAASSYLTIGSATVNIKWFGGTKPSGNVNSEDFYTFTIFKTNDTGNGTFTVIASQSKFA